MRGIFLAAATCFCGANCAQAQVIEIQTKKIGKQVITEIQTLPARPAELIPAPADVGRGQPGDDRPGELKLDFTPTATPAVIKIRAWNYGRVFVDEKGQRWRLVRGDSVVRFPTQLSGWRLITVDGEELFFTITGRLFTSQ